MKIRGVGSCGYLLQQGRGDHETIENVPFEAGAKMKPETDWIK
jgi:hypothetical protein